MKLIIMSKENINHYHLAKQPKSTIFYYFSMIVLVCIIASCDRPNVKLEAAVSQKIIPVLISKENNVVMRIRINIEEDKESVLQRIKFSTQGVTDLQDIETVGVYYTGQSDVFSDHVLFGNLQSGVTTYSFKSEQTLKTGNNYFWLSVKLKQDAGILNKIGFRCTEVKVNDASIMPVDSTSGLLRIGHALRDKGQDGSEAFRIPGLITTSKGTLVAVYDIRWRNADDLQNDIDIGINRSTDKGQTWLHMQKAMDMGEWGGLPQEQNWIGDPCILIDEKTGRLWIAALWGYGGVPGRGPKIYYTQFSGPGISPVETGQFMLVYSDDDGLTWSDPINITSQVKKPEWNICFQGPGMGITMKDGTLVFPAQFKDKDNMNYSTIISSQDHGQTWQVGTGACAETNEAQVAEIEPGVLMLNMRINRGGSRAVSISRDLGKTWEVHPSSHSALRDPACMASLIKVDAARNIIGKDILLFSNPNRGDRGRSNMTIKASFDGGLTWPEQNQLLLDEGNGWGYSCLTMIDSETVGIFYEGSGAQICFQAILLKEIVK